MPFHVAEQPKTVSAVVATQFPTLTLTASGQSFPNETPDGVVAIGRLEDDALISIQIEGGKRNDRLTGTQEAPSFREGVRTHQMLDAIIRASATGSVHSID
jgi:hypothetical protein